MLVFRWFLLRVGLPASLLLGIGFALFGPPPDWLDFLSGRGCPALS